MAQLVKVKATVEKIIYQNDENWYSVCDVTTEKNESLTIVGIMPYISVGEEIEASGSFTISKEHGRQFKVDDFKKILPKEKNSILRYLSSGAVKGVGPKIAKKIVDQYGEDSFDVIANHPEWLIQINGISRKKAYDISFDFKEKSDIRDILTFSNGTISSTNAIKVHKKWGKNALGILKENPYKLCDDDFGIGFKKADEIAFSFGISAKDTNRLECGIKYVLRIYASRDGHTYVPTELLKESAIKLLGVSSEDVADFFNEKKAINGVSFIYVGNQPCAVLNDLYFAEMNIAKHLKQINKWAISLNSTNVEYMINDLEQRDNIKYASLQKKTIYEALSNGVTILTGGPGTGKTTIIKALIAIFEQFGMKCALCAPTGRAAKRMSESTVREAKTIHRLLEVKPGDEFDNHVVFGRNKSNPLDCDVLIVDETSMIDIMLMNYLLNAIKPGARVIFIGDINQLPSVGEGNVLHDMINSDCFSTVYLNEIFRQSRNSGIVVNAHKINNGVYPDLKEKFDDFFFISMSESKIPEYITDLCKNRMPKKYGRGTEDKIQVISPTKKGLLGTINLNSILQASLNPSDSSKKEQKRGELRTFREGDRIMQLKNNYDVEWEEERNGIDLLGEGVFNGDVGKIAQINDDQLLVDFQGKKATYNRQDLDQIDHSYAITVHKSQGSEYPFVIIPVSSSCPYVLLTRNLIYTALTRAERMVIVVGDWDVFCKMIDNNTHVNRNTLLERLLRNDKEAI